MRSDPILALCAAFAVASCSTASTIFDGGISNGGGTTGGSSGGTGDGDAGACLTIDMPCGSTQPPGCCGGLLCVSDDNDAECLVANGGSCTQDYECVSEACDGGHCQCQTLGNVAFAAPGCCSPLGLANGPAGGPCCGLAGHACHGASDCCTTNCQSGQCL